LSPKKGEFGYKKISGFAGNKVIILITIGHFGSKANFNKIAFTRPEIICL